MSKLNSSQEILIENCRKDGAGIHGRSNKLYATYPYRLHLDGVLSVGRKYMHLLDEQDALEVLCAIPYHDCIEDCDMNFNSVKNAIRGIALGFFEYDFREHGYYTSSKCNYKPSLDTFVDNTSLIVYNVTNELGRNGEERLAKTYPKIKPCKKSKFVKLSDRTANMLFSRYINDNSGMMLKYINEFPDFEKALYDPKDGLDPMWQELKKLVELDK